MGRRKSKTLPLGVISSGTHNTEALFDAYYDALDSLQLSRETRMNVRQMARQFKDANEETRAAIVDELTMLLEDHAPYGAYFGAHEGDGALFGVWPYWDYLTSEERDGFLKRGDTLPTITKAVQRNHIEMTYFLLINDHGNSSLYRRAGNRWVYVWGVV